MEGEWDFIHFFTLESNSCRFFMTELKGKNTHFACAAVCFCAVMFITYSLSLSQVAEKEAHLVRQEEEKTEQRRRAKADKKNQKKGQKGSRPGDKRKAEDKDYEDEWGEESGKEKHEDHTFI